MQPTLFRIVLPVLDVDQAESFYRKLLGMPGERISPNRHYFKCGETILVCLDHRLEGNNQEIQPNPEHIYFAVYNLEEVFERAMEAGCLWLEDSIKLRHWGERSFYAKDPFGNRLCFVDEATKFTGLEAV